jgi:hypothetical protein
MIDTGLGSAHECQYIGSEQTKWPYKMCGQKSIAGKSYCAEHYHQMYKKGSSNTGAKKMEKLIDKELSELKRQQEIEEIDNV